MDVHKQLIKFWSCPDARWLPQLINLYKNINSVGLTNILLCYK